MAAVTGVLSDFKPVIIFGVAFARVEVQELRWKRKLSRPSKPKQRHLERPDPAAMVPMLPDGYWACVWCLSVPSREIGPPRACLRCGCTAPHPDSPVSAPASEGGVALKTVKAVSAETCTAFLESSKNDICCGSARLCCSELGWLVWLAVYIYNKMLHVCLCIVHRLSAMYCM